MVEVYSCEACHFYKGDEYQYDIECDNTLIILKDNLEEARYKEWSFVRTIKVSKTNLESEWEIRNE